MATRDLPKSLGQLLFGWKNSVPNEITIHKSRAQLVEEDYQPDGDKVRKFTWSSCWPAFAAGFGLFSDGYVNASIGSVSTILGIMYPTEYKGSNAVNNVSSIAFVGIVVGQLSFGYIADRIDRKKGMLAANVILIVFTILCSAATWGANGSVYGMFAALTTFRFFLGVGIGAEYPTASVISSEFANQLPSGIRNRVFAMSTNCAINLGFVTAAFVPLILLWIFSPDHLTAVWRLTLGLGAIPPIALFFLRLKMVDSKVFKKYNMKHAKYPVWLCLKFYWYRLAVISALWFIYNFSAFSFGIYSSAIINNIVPDGDLYKTFGWNTLLNVFYLPGCFLGAFFADWFGVRITLTTGLICQAVFGFAMAGAYPTLKQHVASFVVVFGFFTAFGEFGPGNSMGLISSKLSATAVRGVFYGIAAAMGKIGAFVGTWVFPVIIKNAGGSDTDSGNQAPFYVSSSLCLFAALLAWFFLPYVGQDSINREDDAFLEYLHANGYDISQLGDRDSADSYSEDIENQSAGYDNGMMKQADSYDEDSGKQPSYNDEVIEIDHTVLSEQKAFSSPK